MIPIHVSMLPILAEQTNLHSQVAVMIDILRASTTIVHALANSAQCVIPCATVEQAKALGESTPAEKRLLGGERHCQRIEGFDLDNSPLKYESQVVAGKQVIFTTTNGTLALQRCHSAERVFIGAFVNLGALIQNLQRLQRPIHLICAGTNGSLTAEDILFAGAVADELLKSPEPSFEIADVQAQMALDFYRARNTSPDLFRSTMMESLGAENLIRLGLQADIERAMEIDRFSLLPEWDPQSNMIRPVTV